MNAYHKAIEADNNWSKLLRVQFGRNAGDARYTKAGKGDVGTELRAAHDRFQAANKAWLAEMAQARLDPLPRCVHGACLLDGSGERLEPPCGCRQSVKSS